MQTQPIPLSQLRQSPSNVRKTGGMSIDDIAASIVAHGLIHNLIVTPLPGGEFDVVAGGRRLKALQQLVDSQQIPSDFVVPCRVIDASAAAETSLAENVQRQAMHPADEFDAYAGLTEILTPSQIAERFGTTEKHVQQRLRLSRVAPKILAEYRAGEATLEQMMALAFVDDHAAQERVWGKVDGYQRQPQQLRANLSGKEVHPNSKLGRFLTPAEYEAAGGEAHRDLFSDLVTLPDVAIATKAAHTKLQPEVEKLTKKGWGWVEIQLDADAYGIRQKYRQQHSAKPDAKLGAIIVLDYNGKAEIHTGLVKPGAKKPAAKAGSTSAAKGPKESKGLSIPATYELQARRTVALRGHLLENSPIAFAALAASLANGVFDDVAKPVDSFLGVGGESWRAPALDKAIAEASPAITKQINFWRTKIVAGVKRDGSILAWLLKEGEDRSLDLIHFCASVALAADVETEEFVHDFARLVDVDMTEGWKLTVDWLAKQSKAYIVAEVRAFVGDAQAKALDKLKLPDAAKAAFPLLSIAKWLPEPLRPPAPPAAKKAAKKKAKA